MPDIRGDNVAQLGVIVMILGTLEAGGTKMVCGIGDENGNVFERVSFPTRMPEETMADIIGYFQDKNIEALGIGTFGPVNLNKADPNFGSITTTPKPGWGNYPMFRVLKDALNVPMEIDTDVNAAALGEVTYGAAKGLKNCLYVTIGTGVGGGLIVEGNLVHGLLHPEFGHMLLTPHPDDPSPKGFCPYHESCVEGMICGPAVEKRWGVSAKELPPDHKAWEIEADYLAQMCMNAILAFSPECIVLGGGVMHQMHLFDMVRAKTVEKLNGYVANDRITGGCKDYIVSPGLGDNAGAVGGLILARKALGL